MLFPPGTGFETGRNKIIVPDRESTNRVRLHAEGAADVGDVAAADFDLEVGTED